MRVNGTGDTGDCHQRDKLYGQVENKSIIADFVKRQLKNTRKPVAKRAERFARAHAINP
jgi:hypothetical protein